MSTSTTRSTSLGKLVWAGISLKEFMRRLVYLAALALALTLVLASRATAQQMHDDQMMDDGRMMNDNMMASPSASASASPSATASTSATGTASATATTFAARGDHEGGGRSASVAVGGQLPRTGGVPLMSLVSVGALALLMGSGLVATRLLRRGT